eukprot:2203575-Pyramimonas_sp.AAC.1
MSGTSATFGTIKSMSRTSATFGAKQGTSGTPAPPPNWTEHIENWENVGESCDMICLGPLVGNARCREFRGLGKIASDILQSHSCQVRAPGEALAMSCPQ